MELKRIKVEEMTIEKARECSDTERGLVYCSGDIVEEYEIDKRTQRVLCNVLKGQLLGIDKYTHIICLQIVNKAINIRQLLLKVANDTKCSYITIKVEQKGDLLSLTQIADILYHYIDIGRVENSANNLHKILTFKVDFIVCTVLLLIVIHGVFVFKMYNIWFILSGIISAVVVVLNVIQIIKDCRKRRLSNKD